MEQSIFSTNNLVFQRSDWDICRIHLQSKDSERESTCNFTVQAFNYHLRIELPDWVCPPDKWVWEYRESRCKMQTQRTYGISLCDNHFCISFGSTPFNEGVFKGCPKTQDWSCFLPWSEWQHVRHSIYDLEHCWIADLHNLDWKEIKAIKEQAPKATFAFNDYDGELLAVDCQIEEREWRLGEGLFKWLGAIVKPRIIRSLDLEFSGETGERKGSYKGGTVGHSIEMQKGESPERAFRRYCDEHNMTFMGEPVNV